MNSTGEMDYHVDYAGLWGWVELRSGVGLSDGEGGERGWSYWFGLGVGMGVVD